MNRRDLLKAAPLVGGLFVPGSAEAKQALRSDVPPNAPDSKDWLKDYVDAVLEFETKMPVDCKRTGMNIPFATLPTNVYVMRNTELAELPCLEKLQPLVRLLRSGYKHAGEDMANVALRLWDRWKPLESPWVETKDDTLDMLDPKEPKRTPYGLASRVATPKYIIDLYELDTFRLARFLVSVKDIATELRRLTAETKEAWGKPITKHTAAYTPLQAVARVDFYMLEFMASVVSAGRIS